MKSPLERLFSEIVNETKTNLGFGKRIAEILGSLPSSKVSADKTSTSRARNRRDRAALDPYREFSRGEEHVRRQLASLTVEQLKDIVSEHAMDSSRLALKWKSPERLVELILSTVRERTEKGDVFRS